MPTLFKHGAVRILVPPFIGLLCYGGWAYWVNMDHGPMAGFKAACTQGLYSFTITLVLALVVEFLFKAFASLPLGNIWVGLVACSILYSSSWGLNALAGTPNILLTILPGAAASTVYTVMYIITLNKLNH